MVRVSWWVAAPGIRQGQGTDVEGVAGHCRTCVGHRLDPRETKSGWTGAGGLDVRHQSRSVEELISVFFIAIMSAAESL